jgi:cation:H+ antiporter
MLVLPIVLLIVGLVLLYFGAEWLVNGASSLALGLGITPLIVGLTVVSFGTSAPELLVSLLGSDDVSVGNIIGSNIANIALILGAAALVRPIEVQARAVRRELPFMIVASALFVILAMDGSLTRLDGAFLLLGMLAYLVYTFFEARKDMKRLEELLGDGLEEVDPNQRSRFKDALLIVVGIVGLAAGAQLMVSSAVTIAEYFQVSQLVIAISIIAIGTSLPELATSMVASFRGESDISVGNVIGSNIFNVLFVLGIVATVAPIVVDETARTVDLWVMMGISVGIWPFLRTGHRLSRPEGALLLALYLGYMVYLFMR